MAEATTEPSSKAVLGGIVIAGVASIGLFVTSFYVASKYVGNSDNSKQIEEIMPKFISMGVGAGVLLFIAGSIYVSQIESTSTVNYGIIGMSCLALCCSYISIAVSVLTS